MVVLYSHATIQGPRTTKNYKPLARARWPVYGQKMTTLGAHDSGETRIAPGQSSHLSHREDPGQISNRYQVEFNRRKRPAAKVRRYHPERMSKR